ncbi:MAG: hypothetical protein GTN81_03790 [Proteobacteria bacterium]|nr:hypothetical protein [Pseudomonadota bacterium]
MDWLSYVVAGVMVYVALGISVLGMSYRVYQWLSAPKARAKTGVFPKAQTRAGRWFKVAKDSFIFRDASTYDRWMWVFTVLFHLGLLGALVGHLRLVREFTPLVNLLGDNGMEQLSLLGGGLMGIILLAALAFYLLRRLTPPYKEMSILEDYLLLILLILIVVMGNHMRFAGKVNVGDYRAYIQSLVALKPSFSHALASSSTKSALVFHVLFVNLLLMYLPFSKLVHMIATFPANLAKRV